MKSFEGLTDLATLYLSSHPKEKLLWHEGKPDVKLETTWGQQDF